VGTVLAVLREEGGADLARQLRSRRPRIPEVWRGLLVLAGIAGLAHPFPALEDSGYKTANTFHPPRRPSAGRGEVLWERQVVVRSMEGERPREPVSAWIQWPSLICAKRSRRAMGVSSGGGGRWGEGCQAVSEGLKGETRFQGTPRTVPSPRGSGAGVRCQHFVGAEPRSAIPGRVRKCQPRFPPQADPPLAGTVRHCEKDKLVV